MPGKNLCLMRFTCGGNALYLLIIKVTAMNFTGGAGSREVEKEESGGGCLNLVLSRHEIHILTS